MGFENITQIYYLFIYFAISTYQRLVLYTVSPKPLFAVNTIYTQNYHFNTITGNERNNKVHRFLWKTTI